MSADCITYLVHGHVRAAWHSLDPTLHWLVSWMLCCVEMEFQMSASFVIYPKISTQILSVKFNNYCSYTSTWVWPLLCDQLPNSESSETVMQRNVMHWHTTTDCWDSTYNVRVSKRASGNGNSLKMAFFKASHREVKILRTVLLQ